MQLYELQRAFQDRVLAQRDAIETELNLFGSGGFAERLDTYVGGYRSRLLEALASTYPVLKATLGDAEFARELRDYVDATPSRHYSIRYYGAPVAERMASRFPAPRGLALAELARWEWTLAEVFDAADDEPLPVTALASVPPDAWPSLTFTPRASMRRVETHTNAVDWWRAANSWSKQQSELVLTQPRELMLTQPQQWLLWRRGITTHFRSMDRAEATLWDQATRGAPFGTLCECLLDFSDESSVAMAAATYLKSWLTEELVEDCSWSTPAITHR